MKAEDFIFGAVEFLEGRIAEREEEGLDTELLEQVQESYGKMLSREVK